MQEKILKNGMDVIVIVDMTKPDHLSNADQLIQYLTDYFREEEHRTFDKYVHNSNITVGRDTDTFDANKNNVCVRVEGDAWFSYTPGYEAGQWSPAEPEEIVECMRWNDVRDAVLEALKQYPEEMTFGLGRYRIQDFSEERCYTHDTSEIPDEQKLWESLNPPDYERE